MGEFICVCAIDTCEIKTAEMSVCNTHVTGWGSPSPMCQKWGEKGMQGNGPRWWLWEAGGDSFLGSILVSGRWPHCTSMWCFQWGCYLFLHVSFLLHSSCLTYIKSQFAFMEWDFWEARNDKTRLCFAGGFPPCPLLPCLPRLPAPALHPTQPGAKREKNTRRIQFTNRNKHLFSRFYIITKQNQGRKKK